ncbi:tRNA (34-2'-O)-methyltransferase regulator WDR6-like [Zophobas morio]|uniref:tRNA (34-2'-O)-methyltransferase regulator WDR6-like n=1 Tax=Zophobas morio TaxID=2755281 RepID=UPI003082B9F1
MKQQNIIEENKFDHPLAETFTLIQSNLFEREDITIFHYLKGCKGAIYDLAFNSSLTSICSASDDRTIRVWDLRNLTEDKNSKHCSFTIYGHEARIWKVTFLDDHIVSVGEDSKVCIWAPSCELIKSWTPHSGGIRALCSSLDNKYIITGGDDHVLAVWNVEVILKENEAKILKINLNCSAFNNDKVRTVHILSPNSLVLTSNKGNLYKAEINIDGTCLVTPMAKHILSQSESGFSNSCELANDFSPSCSRANRTSNISKVLLCRSRRYLAIGERTYDDENVCWLSWHKTTEKSLELFSSNARAEFKWWKIRICHSTHHAGLVLTQSLEYLPCSACLYVITTTQKILLAGDKHGNLHVIYLKKNELGTTEEGLNRPGSKYAVKQYKILKVHNKQAILNILCVTQQQKVFTCGRDGYLCELKWLNNKSEIHYDDEDSSSNVNTDTKQLVCFNKIRPFSQSAQLLDILWDDCDLLLCGFVGATFQVYNRSSNRKLWEVTCTGSHRSLDFLIKKLADEHFFAFAYIKNHEIHWLFDDQPQSPFLFQKKFHHRRITSVKALPLNSEEDEFIYCITGGEDCCLYISELKNPPTTVAHIETPGHTIRAISICRCPKEKSLFFSDCLVFWGGSKGYLDACMLTLNNVTKLLEVKHLGLNLRKPKEKVAGRIMAVVSFPTSDNKLSIITASSGGRLSFYAFDANNGNVDIQLYNHYHERCILCLKLCELPNKKRYLFSTDTGGRIALWDLSNLSSLNYASPLYSVTLHQSGVNCLSTLPLTGEDYKDNHLVLVVTGGDDNALCAVIVEFSENNINNDKARSFCTVKTKAIVRDEAAHAATITGLCLLEHTEEGTFLILTASADQRTILRKLVYNFLLQTLHFTYISGRLADISDIATMELLSNEKFIIVGNGLQTFQVLKETNLFKLKELAERESKFPNCYKITRYNKKK